MSRTMGGLISLLLWVSLTAANIDDALHFYETLHPTQFHHKITKRDVSSDSPHIRQVEFNSLGRHFHLYLQKKKSLLSSSFKVVAIDSNNKHREVRLDDPWPYEGYLIGEATSEVHAMWEDEDNLAASIHTKNDVVIVEPSWRHLPKSDNYSMIIYRKSDVKMDTDLGKSFCGYVDANKEFNLPKAHIRPDTDQYQTPYHTYNQHRHAWNKVLQNKVPRPKRDVNGEDEDEVGPMALPLTFKPYHTTCQVLLIADYLFFENMGKSSLVKTSSYLIGLLDRVDALYRKTDFGGNYLGMGFEIKEIRIHESFTPSKRGHMPHYNEKLTKPWQTKLLLEAFSAKSSREYCLAHLFTARGLWADNVGMLGLSYVASPNDPRGGVCSTDYYKNRTRLYLNTGWSSALNRHKRRLLTQEADLVTTHEFGHNWGSEHDPDTSECSPSAFDGGKYVMYTYSVSGYDGNNKIFSPCSRRSIGAVLHQKAQSCFSTKGKSFCGNSHVEGPDEECDVGPEGHKGGDTCCDENCRLKPPAKCSDMNDLCCLNCQYASNTTVCHEQIDDVPTCEGIAHCTGLSATCPRPKQMNDSSPCLERGSCRAGRCIPLCESKGLVSCICDQVDTACHWCCKANHNSTCISYVEDAVTNQTLDLPDGMPCIQGSCFKGKCERQTQDLVQRIWKIIENITPDQLVEFMRANIVGTVIILSLVIWIPVSCIVSWRDRNTARDEKLKRNWHQADNDTLYLTQDAQRVRTSKSLSHQRHKGRHSFPDGRPLATNC